MIFVRPTLALGLGLLTTACATFLPDAGMSSVVTAAREQVGAQVAKIASEADAARVNEKVTELLRAPVSPDSAVQIALLNNRSLQAAYNDLGLAEIDSVEAGLPPNPKLSLARLSGPNYSNWAVGLMSDILALATLPARKEIALQRFAQAQQVAIEATYRTTLDTRRAWVSAVAARQTVGFFEQSRMAADATADLMRKLGETGGATKLEQARTGAAYAEISAQLARARLRARQEHEALTRLLGLWGTAREFRIPSQLPPLPRTLDRIADIETEAVTRRVDLTIARQELAIVARSLKLTEATRYVSVLELAGIGEFERTSGQQSNRGGLDVALEIPIFDGGEVKLRREIESYMRAVNRLAAKAVAVRSEARGAYQTYLGSHEIAAQYQNRVLPLRRIVSQETLLRYNGMLTDVFDLLAEARERIASNIAAIEARRAFLLAEIDLRAAIIGGGGANSPGEMPNAAPVATSGGGH